MSQPGKASIVSTPIDPNSFIWQAGEFFLAFAFLVFWAMGMLTFLAIFLGWFAV